MLFSKFFWNFNFTFLILWSKFALYQRNCNFYSAMKDLKEKNYVLGIDMGGTNTEFAVVNARGEIVDRDSIPTVGHRDIYDYVARLKSGVEALVKRSNTRGCLRGIGVGAPCANRYTGYIEAATDLPWYRLFRLLHCLNRLSVCLCQSPMMPMLPLPVRWLTAGRVA